MSGDERNAIVAAVSFAIGRTAQSLTAAAKAPRFDRRRKAAGGDVELMPAPSSRRIDRLRMLSMLPPPC
jgi:hypothetical protein